MAADRHLLFGLLALQTGLIQQAQLVAAFHAWTCDKSRTLADHLVALGHLNAAQRAAVEALAALHVEAHGGDVERSLAAVPAGKPTRDDLASLGDPDIEAPLGHVGSAHPPRSADEDDPDRTASISVGSATSDGQRFRILRPYARGGLGAVFVAFDCELHREVALKQIHEEHADDPFSRERFIAEAEITGGLEHPGVVPVYGLGADARGHPYYAMRFIKGDSLKAAIARFHAHQSSKQDPGRRSLELRKLLHRFTDVCNAADYAHSRGVIHRDLKPTNIIVGKHGETLVVDWGLAKSVGRADRSIGEQTIAPSSSGSSETQPGSVLGTPAYMSPEQARGELNRLGPRSDVYSLGATLYCLLTGRPPFEAEDIGSVLHAVEQGQFPRPSRLDPALDKALEAVCLKAMATVPKDRYPTPRALADDLDRWMADEPVTAWREPLSRRARRWGRRNRTAVAAALVALVFGVVGLSAVAAVQTRARADIAQSLASETRAHAALDAANKQLSRSQAAVQTRYDLALEAIKTFHTGVSEDFLLKEDRFKVIRDRLLKSASDFYRKLAALPGKETDLASRRALEQSNFELAELTAKVGRPEDALAAHRAVLAAREALAAEPGAGAAAKADVGRSLTAVASLLEAMGKTDEAVTAHRRAESLLAGPAGSDPEARAALAACRARLGYLLGNMGALDAARAAHEAALADRRALAAARPNDLRAAVELAASLDVFGHFKEQIGRTAEALASFQEGRAVIERAAAAELGATSHRKLLAHLMVHVGSLLFANGQPAAAEAEYRTALALQQKLADDSPAVIEFRIRLADTHANLGFQLRDATGRPEEALDEYRAEHAILQKLADDNPAVADFRSRLAGSHDGLGDTLKKMGRLMEWGVHCRAALAILQKSADDNPADTDFQSRLAESHMFLGWMLLESGQEAEAEFRKSVAISEKLAADHPEVADLRSKLATMLHYVGLLLEYRGDLSNAEAEHRKALAIFHMLADSNPRLPVYRNSVASAHAALSSVLRRLGRPAEARDHDEWAIAAREGVVKEDPTNREYREGLSGDYVSRGLCGDYLSRGMTRRALGDFAGSAADIRRALKLLGEQPQWWYWQCLRSAWYHSALAGLAGQPGSGVSAAEGASEAETAMTLLRKAVAMNYRNAAALRTLDLLDPLRGRDDFRLLMMDIAFPAEPFAPGR
jgi:serine/threonine-protein kinase